MSGARFITALVGLVLGLVLLAPAPARAANCTAQMSDINFGAVSLRAGASNRTTGTLNIECQDPLAAVVGVCVRFGPGSGGAGAGNSPRYMGPVGAGADQLAWQMRSGGYGALNGTLNEVFVLVPILPILTTGEVSVPIFAEILSTGTEVDPGSYASVFSGAGNIRMDYGLLSCDLFGTGQALPQFQVSAEVTSSCELDVGALDFGRIGSLGSAPADAVGAVDVRCTAGTDYSVSMGLGSGPGVSDPAQRKMRNGPFLLDYGLYRDAARSLVWGEAPGQRASATGIGSTQRFNVYGRIHQGQDTQIGLYSDNVVVTVNY